MPLVQILDQVGDAAIEIGELATQRDEVFAMRVPAAVAEGDAADARFDQPAGGEELLDAAIAIARARIFTVQIERLPGGARGDHAEGAVGEGVEPLHGAAGVDVASGTLSNCVNRPRRSFERSVETCKLRLERLGPSGVKARCETPRKPCSPPIDMPAAN